MSMDDFFNNITVQLTPDDASAVEEALKKKTHFLRLAFSMNLDHVILPLDPALKKDKALGQLWKDVKPVDGTYQFELATQLPYYLPYFDGAPDYCVRVGNSELFISGQMIRCFYQPEDSESRLAYWLIHRKGLSDLTTQRKLTQYHPLPVPTLVSKKVSGIGESAEAVFQASFYKWTEDLANDVSLLVDAIRTIKPIETRHLLPILGPNMFPLYYLVAYDGEENGGAYQVAAQLSNFGFRGFGDLDTSEVDRLKEHLNTEVPIPIAEYSLALAKTFVHYGYLHLALVQICTACESVLANRYRAFLLQRGVSNSKYRDAEREISFSHLLNLHLATMYDVRKIEGFEDLLGSLNWARKHRNEIVHEGMSGRKLEKSEIERALNAAKVLVMHLEKEPDSEDGWS